LIALLHDSFDVMFDKVVSDDELVSDRDIEIMYARADQQGAAADD